MPNDYYNNTTNPAFLSAATSASVRNQFAAIKAAFDLLPAKADIYDGKVNYGTCTGSSNAYVLSTNMGVTALSAGATVAFTPNHANTGAATINVDALGVKDIKQADGNALETGELITTQPVVLVYNGTNWRLIAGDPKTTKAYIDAAAAAGGAPGAISFQELGIGTATAYDQVQVNAAGTALEAVALTASRALVSDANGGLAVSAATAAQIAAVGALTTDEIGYVSGVTSAIQTQLNAVNNMPYAARTSDTVLATADKGKYLSCTGSWSQTFTAAATLADGWWVVIKNAGTGIITLDPNGTEQIDGAVNNWMYPSELRLIVCTGTAFVSTVLQPFYLELTATATGFAIPNGYTAFGGLLWGGGGSGSSTGSGGGGGGGACVPFIFDSGDIGATINIAIGAGGIAVVNADGNVGGNSTIIMASKTVTAYGGGGGNTSGDGGGGGGALGAGTAVTGGAPSIAATNNPGFGGGYGGSGGASYSSVYGGGGGGISNTVAGAVSVYGGGGGGGCNGGVGATAGGVSTFGGNGGAGSASGAGTAGAVPGGGGGGVTSNQTSGAGAAGKCTIWGIV